LPNVDDDSEVEDSGTVTNSQKMNLATPSIGPGVIAKDAGVSADVQISKDSIAPTMGPVGSPLDVANLPTSDQISVYTVHAGDTVSSVAKLFGVSKATIIDNNDISANQALVPGSVIVILPTSGLQVTIKSGDTLKSIGKKYKVDPKYIAFYNDMTLDDMLTIGDTLIIPDAESDSVPTTISAPKQPSSGKVTIPKLPNAGLPNLDGYFIPPIDGGYETNDLHGFHKYAVDIAAPVGTQIHASVGGTVIVAKTSGYNTGYGKFVVISSTINGYPVQTLYAHMSQVNVSVGQTVGQGEVIGLVGSTGRSTGAHTHFEVRGAQNPFRRQFHRTVYIKQF